MAGVAQEDVILAQQAEVNAPGVHPDPGDLPAIAGPGGSQAGQDMRPLAQQVPVEMAGHVDRAVIEAVEFLKLKGLAVEPSDDVSPTRSPHVNRQICLVCHRSPSPYRAGKVQKKREAPSRKSCLIGC